MGGAPFRGFMIMLRCTVTAAMATLCRLPSQKTSLVVLIVRAFLSLVLTLLLVRAQPTRSPTAPPRTRTASPWCGRLQVPCQGRSSSRQQSWGKSQTDQHIGRKSDQTQSLFDVPARKSVNRFPLCLLIYWDWVGDPGQPERRYL